MAIACRSPQEIADDALLNALSMCDEALSAFHAGMGYLYVGERRQRIKAHKARLEGLILDGQSWTSSVPVGLHTHYVIHRG